jgi:hypothetical protein
MKITGALVSATVLLVLASMPRLAEAQCGVAYGDYDVNEAEGTIEAWTFVQETFEPECPWAGGYQWGYFEHHYATTVEIESPTQNSAYDEDYQVMPYGGGGASTFTSISYLGDPGEYVIDLFIGVSCTIGGTLGFWLDEEEEDVPAQTSCPLPPYEFHQALPSPGGRMQVEKTGPLSNAQIDVTAYVHTLTQAKFDSFNAGVTSLWNRTFTGPGVNVTLNVELIRLAFPGAHDVFVDIVVEPPSGGPSNNPDPDNCGTFTPGPGASPDSILVRNHPSCNVSRTSAHEFGHDMRFSNAYVVHMCPLALHCDQTDLMACGNQLHAYHGQLLWERL